MTVVGRHNVHRRTSDLASDPAPAFDQSSCCQSLALRLQVGQRASPVAASPIACGERRLDLAGWQALRGQEMTTYTYLHLYLRMVAMATMTAMATVTTATILTSTSNPPNMIVTGSI